MNKKVYILGYFDALHIGHRTIIEEGRRLSKEGGCSLCAVTFDDGLYESLGLPYREVFLLRERKKIFGELGVETLVLPSNREFLNKSSEDFARFLADLHPYALVAGTDWRYGKNAAGNVNTLKEFYANIAPEVKISVCSLLTDGADKVSTTSIRNLIADGRMREANALLGGAFFVSGPVVGGHGRKMGFPTANLEFDSRKIVPKWGVYATRTVIDGDSFVSITNVGNHPTFGDEHINSETYIFDYDGDLYGKDITVEFYEFIRELKTFSSASELKSQIDRDIITTKKVFELC